jgi:hypothetical protein
MATRNRIVQWLGAMAASTVFTVLAWRCGEQWPAQFEFSFADYALMASIVLASFGLAVAGVARQRHGDAPVATPRLAASGGFSDWLVNLFQFPCPRSSATRAQVWFDLKSTGLPGLTIVLACAMVNPLLFAIGGPVAPLRPYAVMFAGFSVLVVLFLGGNAFGVRRRQGRIYASVFETTQARGTGPLAALKVLVRTVCMLAALVAIGASLWASLSLVSAWGKDAPGFMQLQHSIEIAVGGLTGYQQVAVAVVTFIAAAVIVASRAALEALRARYPRRVVIAGSVLLLYALALVVLAMAGQRWSELEIVVDGIFGATPWITLSAIVLVTLYLLWNSIGERLLTLRQAGGAVLVSAAFGVAWAIVLRAAGVPLAGMSQTHAGWILSLVLLPLTSLHSDHGR